MIANTIEIEGTLQPDGKLILDEKPAMPPGRVRVALQAIGNATNPDVLTVLQGIRAAQTARGHAPRTREEIDADIDAMRGEDEVRMQAVRAEAGGDRQGRLTGEVARGDAGRRGS